LTPSEAAVRVLETVGLHGPVAAAVRCWEGAIEDVSGPLLPAAAVLAVVAAGAEGQIQPAAATALAAAKLLAVTEEREMAALLLVPSDEKAQRRAAAEARQLFPGDLVLLVLPEKGTQLISALLVECWRAVALNPQIVVGEPWTEDAFASLSVRPASASGTPERSAPCILRVHRLTVEGETAVLETGRAGGKLRARQTLPTEAASPCWISLTTGADVAECRPAVVALSNRVQRWSPHLERFFSRGDVQRLLGELKEEIGVARLADADFIIDVGFGVGNRDGYETVIDPLEQALRQLGVHRLVIGGSRKVTEELHLLPADRQIGQSGVSVRPRVLLAIGISGAPQHMNYISPQTTIIAFNRDPEAPIMTWNRRQPRPRVFPVVGDLFETVPALIAGLGAEERHAEGKPPEATVTQESGHS
jgi:hypothetical protein